MNESALIEAWRREEAAPFSGWDFSHIAGRFREDGPPWSYAAMAREALRGARSAVDLGTGGGEVLASLREAFPPLTVATEAYPPNVAVANRRLSPLGGRVVATSVESAGPSASVVQDRAAPVPFRDASFDVVLDRHEAYDAAEVARALTPGGAFLTQQVDGRSYADLLAHFGVSPQWPGVTLDDLRAELVGAGLVIEDARSWWGSTAFSDVGALVYYLKAIPWMVPGFSVQRFEPVLFQLQRELERSAELRFRAGRFVIRARKPDPGQDRSDNDRPQTETTRRKGGNAEDSGQSSVPLEFRPGR